MKNNHSKSEDKHQRIIKAALKVFAKKGFYNSRVSEIAKEAEVADGTIYLYFKNKDDILISVFETEMMKMISNMKKELSKCHDPVEKIRIFAFQHLNMITENQEWAEVAQVELRQSSKFMREYVKDHYTDYINIFAYIIREGQEKGIFKEGINTGIAKRAFFGALDEMGRYWVLSRSKRYSVEESSEQISDMFIEGVMK
ncbi:MAG: TetR family transcriptional regulator [Deltaproteobacteria bacterium]|jgi:TetR/AcrR family transcriptional regulator, fatty acid metabolism regulator protein|nr:TetR/AcrR family transcriptional regulator [Deltaproteobacteria bacterium]NOQ85715.1 TetR family transcriptional regulator [Deltaproteobacteria bacterium]